MQKKILAFYRLAQLYFQNKKAFHTIRKVRQSNLTYLDTNALLDLRDRIHQIESKRNRGIIVEAGSALGGSALVMTATKKKERSLYLFDTFGMIPPPTDKDESDAHTRYEEIASGQAAGIGSGIYYGYQGDLLVQLRETFHHYGFSEVRDNVHFVKGLYEQTLQITEAVALAHIDCDWHDSVMVCLQRIEPQLVRGGVLIIDDYEAWDGCRKAVDSYFSGREHEFNFVMKSRLQIIRK